MTIHLFVLKSRKFFLKRLCELGGLLTIVRIVAICEDYKPMLFSISNQTKICAILRVTVYISLDADKDSCPELEGRTSRTFQTITSVAGCPRQLLRGFSTL